MRGVREATRRPRFIVHGCSRPHSRERGPLARIRAVMRGSRGCGRRPALPGLVPCERPPRGLGAPTRREQGTALVLCRERGPPARTRAARRGSPGMRASGPRSLQRHGNSQALVLDKPILEMLGAGGDTPLQLSISGGSLIVTPVHTGIGRQQVDRAFDDLQPRYGDMLRRLAE